MLDDDDDDDDDSSDDSDTDNRSWLGTIALTLLQPTHLQRIEQIHLLITHLQYLRLGSHPVFLQAHFWRIA